MKSAAASEKGKLPESAKDKTPPMAAEKGKGPMPSPSISVKRKSVARKKGRARGVVIEEPLVDTASPQAQDMQVGNDRIRAFENRECIGE